MIKTTFLIDHDKDNIKSFSSLNVPEMASKRLSIAQKKTIFDDIIKKDRRPDQFRFTTGRVELKEANQLFCLEHVVGNVDIVLPKMKNLLDWVVLFYDQDRIITNVSYEELSKIKIYGNGSRIMGLDEPMICDVPFMSLRLTYVNDIDGWIIT